MTDPERPALGILAGGGALPGRVAAAAHAAGRPVFIVGLEGFADPAVIGAWPHAVARVGGAARILELLRAHGCRDLVLIGPVRRPSLLDLRPDVMGARLLARAGRMAFAGDDGLLKAVVQVLGEEGFNVIGAHEVLTEAVGPCGLLSRAAPDAQAAADIQRGVAVARALGLADVGQGCIVQEGLVLCVEAIEGTDAMIARSAGLRRPGPGGVLVKIVKPGQDRRADLPTIGPDTIRAAMQAGLRGVAFEAGGTILAERAETVRLVDAAGMFLLGLDAEQLASNAPAAWPPGQKETDMSYRYLHTMLRVGDLDRSVKFYTELFGMKEIRRNDVPDGKYTLVFLGYGDESNATVLELTYNYGVSSYEIGTAFGHLAIGMPDVYAACETMRAAGAKITREPGPVKFGTTVIAFVEDPDGYKIELIQRA